jgi:decaprenyl-phosphate phosphoribosyltransferase
LTIAPPASRTPPRALLAAMRPRQWVKNGVVLAAPVFALRFDVHTVVFGGLALLAFCAVSSGIYLVNDAIDAPADRLHPTKRRRPIASGELAVPVAIAGAVVLLGGGVAIAFGAGTSLGVAAAVYVALSVAYNAGLKREPIVDIMCIAAGFCVRAIAGAVAVGVPASGWFLLCVGLLAFFLGIEKRKAELRTVERLGSTRAVLKVYSLPLLLRMESVATAGAVMSYALWAIGRNPHSAWMLATLPFVAFCLFRYQLLSEQGEGESPEKALLKSPHIILGVALWVVSCVTILYLDQAGRLPAITG